MKYKILMIVNPKAGKAKITKHITKIKENLENLNYIVEIKYTDKEKNANYIIKEYHEDYDILIISGGDGTLNEAISGLYEIGKKVFIGYIPNGTTNDFGKSLDVSFDILNISKKINEYNNSSVDIGLLNNKIFIYSATFGIFTKVSYKTSTKWKNRVGRLAYILSAIKEVFNYKVYKLKVQVDDQKIEDEFIFGDISNSKYIGGFNMFKKQNVKLNDGKFEILLVKKPKNIVELLNLIFKVLTGKKNDKNIYYLQSNNVHIECTENIDWALDGEYGGCGNVFDISVLDKYADFILPKEIS